MLFSYIAYKPAANKKWWNITVVLVHIAQVLPNTPMHITITMYATVEKLSLIADCCYIIKKVLLFNFWVNYHFALSSVHVLSFALRCELCSVLPLVRAHRLVPWTQPSPSGQPFDSALTGGTRRQGRPILFRPLHAWLVGPSREPLAGVLYKRATTAVTTATESTAVTMAREREREHGGGKLAVKGAAVGS